MLSAQLMTMVITFKSLLVESVRDCLHVLEGDWGPGCKITAEAKSEACQLKEMRANY